MKRGGRSAPRRGKEPSQRQLRVGEVVRHALISALASGEIRDPGLDGVSVTVTEVSLSPDLRNATAYVMPLGGVNTAEVVEALQRAAPFLRRLVAGRVELRSVPALSFVADASFDNADRIDELLRPAATDSDPARDTGLAGHGLPGHGEERDGA
jgi:ribosome-binding factor A